MKLSLPLLWLSRSEVAQELVRVVREAGGGAEVTKVAEAVQMVVDYLVLAIKGVAEDPSYGKGMPGVLVWTFREVLPDIKRHQKEQHKLEDAKDTAWKPFQGTAEDAVLKARNVVGVITSLVARIKTLAVAEGQVIINNAVEQVDKVMQTAVQDATWAIKHKATEKAQDSAQDVKEAVH
ncbi:uncharacterized protein NFIA_044840 [Aspergillus fischeri NRRL 181]|uniref:Uncharacterized protein n=1 Tax=Neosartorya fischeri (strain ATCC 1020 / DSM 3700 / CBS 544.65 / FGSC A1164 / JCM 1740 / NRRL 181 / WB 181) TaxID=331117 RepID=A1CV88_NEOFI|nr:uncharacterized protein NFIA_044840 [Aspergillus fischeri NRRL 181]EAW25665.1 hypothetical protein NFIA_044840 [Aspergillus fischeri NRRL 181]